MEHEHTVTQKGISTNNWPEFLVAAPSDCAHEIEILKFNLTEKEHGFHSGLEDLNRHHNLLWYHQASIEDKRDGEIQKTELKANNKALGSLSTILRISCFTLHLINVCIWTEKSCSNIVLISQNA